MLAVLGFNDLELTDVQLRTTSGPLNIGPQLSISHGACSREHVTC